MIYINYTLICKIKLYFRSYFYSLSVIQTDMKIIKKWQYEHISLYSLSVIIICTTKLDLQYQQETCHIFALYMAFENYNKTWKNNLMIWVISSHKYAYYVGCTLFGPNQFTNMRDWIRFTISTSSKSHPGPCMAIENYDKSW